MNWSLYKHGHLAKSQHGCYFVYSKFNHEAGQKRWFAEYEAGSDYFGQRCQLTGKPQGFETLEEAQRWCDQNADEVAKNLGM